MSDMKIENCPFCTAPAGDPGPSPTIDRASGWCAHVVQCFMCGVQGPRCRSEKEAVVFWNRLSTPRIVTTVCAYCAEQFETLDEVAEHIRECPKHPMRATEAERDRLKAEVSSYHELLGLSVTDCQEQKVVINGLRADLAAAVEFIDESVGCTCFGVGHYAEDEDSVDPGNECDRCLLLKRLRGGECNGCVLDTSQPYVEGLTAGLRSSRIELETECGQLKEQNDYLIEQHKKYVSKIFELVAERDEVLSKDDIADIKRQFLLAGGEV